MSTFIDDFYNDDFNQNRIEFMLNNMPTIQEDYDRFLIGFKDVEASINNALYLESIDVSIPFREINIMIERLNELTKSKASNYGKYRACEDYLVKTDWFFNLSSSTQNDIRFDFYNTIVVAIRSAFYR